MWGYCLRKGVPKCSAVDDMGVVGKPNSRFQALNVAPLSLVDLWTIKGHWTRYFNGVDLQALHGVY